jgi:hypothetical protein
MKRLAGVSVLLAMTLGLGWVASRPANAGDVRTAASHSTISRSSRLVLGGRVRCTATVGSQVQVGHAVRVKFTLRNMSRRPVQVTAGVFDSALVVRAADGTIYDTRKPLSLLPGIPAPVPTRLPARKTMRLGTQTVPVRWSGPLRITPECEGRTLRALHVGVLSPGPPADESTALGQVVAASGHFLDECRPQTPGIAVSGQIDPPSGSTPAMSAECSVSLEPEGTFWVAQVLVLVPPGLQGVTVEQPYELFAPPFSPVSPLPTTPPPYEAIAWEFVLTSESALPVAATTADATGGPPSQMEPSWYWNGTAWKLAGTGSCGGYSWAWGGPYPTVEFISACAS